MAARAVPTMRRTPLAMRVAVALGAAFALAVPANAANFVVNSTLDAVDAAPNNGVCATAANFCTLRAAVQEANANATADTIEVPAGTYTLTIAGDDDFAAMGDLDLRTAITIQGAGSSETIIDANGIDRAFQAPFIGGGPPVAIEDLTIRGGAVTDEPGAAVYHGNAGTLLLRGIVFSDNHVAGDTSSAIGGAVSINGGGTATIEDCVLTGNSADRGGAIFSNSPLNLQTSTLSDNIARAGGALELYGTTIIQQSTIAGNEATDGSIVDSDGDLTLRNSTVTGNIATSAVIAAFGSSSVVIERATVADNATDHGILAFTAGEIEIFGSVIAGVASGAACTASGGTVTSLGFNLDDDGSCATQASDITAADPGLGPLAYNGGSTQTRAPQFGSPLLDAGDAFPSCAGTDQRGTLRPQDGGGDPTALCDIGAVEVAPEPASVAAGIAALFALALRRSTAGNGEAMNILEFSAIVWVGSIAAGFLGALSGLGGGVVVIPMLTLLLGVDIRYAAGRRADLGDRDLVGRRVGLRARGLQQPARRHAAGGRDHGRRRRGRRRSPPTSRARASRSSSAWC